MKRSLPPGSLAAFSACLLLGSLPCHARNDASWQFRLMREDTCAFSIVHVSHGRKDKYDGTFDDCESVLEIRPKYLSGTLAIVDAPGERGGHVRVFSASLGAVQHLDIAYEGTDEDSLVAILKDGTLVLSTSLEEIRARIAADDRITIVGRRKKR